LSNLCPWKDHLFHLEEELNINPLIKFVIYEGGSKMWRVQAVPLRPKTFAMRIGLHETWRGLNDRDLVDECGIEGSVFVRILYRIILEIL
jgi:uncharacterized UPF0160 family protein